MVDFKLWTFWGKLKLSFQRVQMQMLPLRNFATTCYFVNLLCPFNELVITLLCFRSVIGWYKVTVIQVVTIVSSNEENII